MRKRQMISERCPVCRTPVGRIRVLVTIKTAMGKIRLSRSTIRRRMLAGKVDWVRLPRGSPRIYLDSLFKTRHPVVVRRRRHVAGRRRGD